LTRILLVDDDAFIRGKLREKLEQQPEWGVVGEAHNGQAALDGFSRWAPHITVMDFQMPVMNGLEAGRHLTGKDPNVLVVLVTAFLSRQLEEEAQKAGIRGACSKAKMPCIIEAVRSVLLGGTYFESQQSALDAGESDSPAAAD
jgi:DNA-binding NarL/FixJ family response regulator